MTSLLSAFLIAVIHFVQPYAIQHHHPLSVDETRCLAKAIYYEGRGEENHGLPIAFVVLNRARLTHASLCETVHKPGQFSYYSKHMRPIRDSDAWKMSVYLATYAQLGLLKNTIGHATAYNERPMESWHRHMIFTEKLGHLYFYQNRHLVLTSALFEETDETRPLVTRAVFYQAIRRSPEEDLRYSNQVVRDSVLWDRIRGRAHALGIHIHVPAKTVAVVIPKHVPFPKEPALTKPQLLALASDFKGVPEPKDVSEHINLHPIVHRIHHRR